MSPESWGWADAVEGIWALDVDDGGWRQFYNLETWVFDEIALTRGHGNYVAVIQHRDAQGTSIHLSGVADRLKATVKAFLELIPAALKRRSKRCVPTGMTATQRCL